MEPNITPVISSLFFSPSDNATSNLSCDNSNMVEALNLNGTALSDADHNISSNRESQLNMETVWPQICNIENTPALKLSWARTSLKRKTFHILNVDPDHVSNREIDMLL